MMAKEKGCAVAPPPPGPYTITRLERKVIRRRFTQAAFDGMMRARERELNLYLAQGSMIGKK